MTSGGVVVLREKQRYVLRRGCPGEAYEELDQVEVLLGGGAEEAHYPSLVGSAAGQPGLGPVSVPDRAVHDGRADRLLFPPARGVDAVVFEEGEQGLSLGVEVLYELAILVVEQSGRWREFCATSGRWRPGERVFPLRVR
jgi:hypothetical protein